MGLMASQDVSMDCNLRVTELRRITVWRSFGKGQAAWRDGPSHPVSSIMSPLSLGEQTPGLGPCAHPQHLGGNLELIPTALNPPRSLGKPAPVLFSFRGRSRFHDYFLFLPE